MSVAILLLLALIGTPLFIVLGAGSLYAVHQEGLDPAVLVIEMTRLGASPNLVAVPLFTLSGVVLARGDAPRRLLNLFNALFGWMPAGLAIAALGASSAFTAFSGASGVTILALGGLLYPMLLREGYANRFSLGLVTSSGSLGLLFPPSLVVLVYGIVAGVNIEQLFLAGLLPGLILLCMLAVFSILSTSGQRPERHHFSLDGLRLALREGIWDLLLPIGVVAGLLGGFVTVTEAATLAASYALVLEMFIHRHLHPVRDLLALCNETVMLVGSIMIILGVAMGLTNLLIDAQLPMRLLDTIQAHLSNPLHFLLLLNVFLLVVGCMLDIFSAIIVVLPLILPLAQRYGIDPIHLGIIFIANLEIGYLTPPVGINLFLASQRFGVPIIRLFHAAWPFLLVMLLWLGLVTYLPVLSLWWRMLG